MNKTQKEIGLAVVGCGPIGRVRAELARDYPGVGWLGVCDIREDLAKGLAADTGADFHTTDSAELLSRPEINAVIVATQESAHFQPVMQAVEQGHNLFIEKPLAVDARESAEAVAAIEAAGVDAVMGYTQRFRRRFLTVKERLKQAQIGDVTAVSARALLNRQIAEMCLARANRHDTTTPVVISGTHVLDMCLWLLEGRSPVSVYAQSTDRIFGAAGSKDSTFAIVTFDDGTMLSLNHSWAAPTVWPGGVYGMQIGIVGDRGVIDIEDMHRDLVLASEVPQGAGYKKDAPEAPVRHVDFLNSIPFGEYAVGQFWGPLREETNAWFQRLHTGLDTPHTSAREGHENLLLCMAIDIAAARGERLDLPLALEQYARTN
ncbi:MAG: Gfo/Idh/MocA family oxidoreductase [Alphaproteobacteria bacterium]|nr:Gfo/Idh/MocA family oxidoreductase [Alphaproteobacteria bacterium]